MSHTLILISEQLPNGRVELQDADLPVTLGRSKRADIPIGDPLLSRLHSEIRASVPGRFEIVDLDSTNLTIVNGHDITSHVLENGDRILLGETELQVQIRRSPGPASQQTTRDMPLIEPRTKPVSGPDSPTGQNGSVET